MPFDNTETNIDTEIENWQNFGYALRKENHELFEKMMFEARAFNVAFDKATNKDPAEALLMALVFQQQKNDYKVA